MPRQGTKRAHEEEVDEDDLLQHLDVAYRKEQQPDKRQKRKLRKLMENEAAFRHMTSERGDNAWSLRPICDLERDRCMKGLQFDLGAEGLDECACVVCDRLVLRLDSVKREESDVEFVQKLRNNLCGFETGIPASLTNEYRAPPELEALSDVLLSPRGMHSYIDDNGRATAWMSVCKMCNDCIVANQLPKFAIANGFYVGKLPERFRQLTIPERLMTQLVTIAAMTRVMRGGRHRCIRSHCIAFDSTPWPPVTLLLRSLDEVATYKVVMVGDFTEAQVRRVKKMHRIRNAVVRGVFDFLH